MQCWLQSIILALGHTPQHTTSTTAPTTSATTAPTPTHNAQRNRQPPLAITAHIAHNTPHITERAVQSPAPNHTLSLAALAAFCCSSKAMRAVMVSSSGKHSFTMSARSAGMGLPHTRHTEVVTCWCPQGRGRECGARVEVSEG
jgi:hypothetical protein